MQTIHKNLILELKKYFEQTSKSEAVIGLSGGVDSALVAYLAVEALGKENVTVLFLPEENITSALSCKLVDEVTIKLDIKKITLVINPILESIKNFPWQENQQAKMNLRPRARMLLLYHFANAHNALVLGTSNKSELLLGYGTKYGDFAADIEVIGNLYKSEVWKLACEVGVPKKIIERNPTAELYIDQTDEFELNAKYKVLDEILKRFEDRNFEPDPTDSDLEKQVLARVKANEHKMQMPIVLAVNREQLAGNK